MRHLDPTLLRTFLAFADKGSLALAAAEVGRTASAVTAQMQRLEAALGTPLLALAGRGRVLTPAGEELVPLARRILDAEREAWLAVRGQGAAGEVRFGATQDFAEALLPALLRTFAASHRQVRPNLRIGRSVELNAAFERTELDLVLALASDQASNEIARITERMIWIGSSDFAPNGEVPVAVLDQPCAFRATALGVLETLGLPFRIAATSPSLPGLMPAVRAGLAATPRTRHALGPGLDQVKTLPALPEVVFALRMRPGASRPVEDFAALLRSAL